jgi:POTRA domain, FtsQ-type
MSRELAGARRSRRSELEGRRRFGLSLAPSPARAAALLGVLASVLALYGLTTAPAAAIERIDVSPLSWTDRAELVQWLGVDPGVNAFALQTDSLAARIEELPTVASAAVTVRLPGTLAVQVTERQPILAWRVHDVTFLVDRDGMLFALAGKGSGNSGAIPTIVDSRAASTSTLSIGTHLDPTDLDAATRLAALTPDDVGSRATGLAIRITDADGFVLATTPGSWIAIFGPYSPVLRTPDLIPGQVRLLRSILFGQEDRLARIVLADDQHGTIVPLATPR